MLPERLPRELTRLVTPRAVKNYAQALGWQLLSIVNGSIAVYRHPTNELRQLVVALDESFDDYPETVAEAVQKLAEYEGRTSSEVLSHLLLPPADVLRFRETGPETETGTVRLDQVIGLLEGTKKMLLSVAHSVLHPQPYHPRLSRSEAEQFVRSCRMGQTERGSFIVTVACPLDFVPGTTVADGPFARQVTQGLMQSLADVADAADKNQVDDLLDHGKHPLLSANFLESLLMLRPSAERASVQVSSSWSKTLPSPVSSSKPALQLDQGCFEAIEYLAPKLRSTPAARHVSFTGVVDQLRGQEGSDGRMTGEVVLFVQEGGESIRARTELSADQYQTAGRAHLANEPVFFRGYLIRGPRINRVDSVSDFRLAEHSGLPTTSNPS